MPNGAERLRRIAELARSVSSALDLEAVLDHVTAAVSALRPDAACSVRLIDQLVGGYRLAGVGLACALAAPASAQLLARKDISTNMALTIAQTALETCTKQGYRVSATWAEFADWLRLGDR